MIELKFKIILSQRKKKNVTLFDFFKKREMVHNFFKEFSWPRFAISSLENRSDIKIKLRLRINRS